jgi:hypothetical protein
MHTFLFNDSTGKKYWLNGGKDGSSTAAQTTALIDFPGPAIGKANAGGTVNYFVGDFAEIIIFKRSLKTEERQAVEDYLSKKYNIKIS